MRKAWSEIWRTAMSTTTDVVAKLWSLCHVLRDDGVTYNEYVTELTFLLFLKMLEETGKESRLPKAYRWKELEKRAGLDQLDYYKRLLLELGQPTIKDVLVRAIFTDAQTRLRKPHLSIVGFGAFASIEYVSIRLGCRFHTRGLRNNHSNFPNWRESGDGVASASRAIIPEHRTV